MQLQHYARVEGSPITNDALKLKKKNQRILKFINYNLLH